jgi:homocysteine S-methyltransferase
MPTVEEVLRAGPVLSEASIFERLRRTPGIEFDPEVGIGALVTDSRWQPALWDIHRSYLEIGLEAGLPVLLQTDTWRAHPRRVARSRYSDRDLNAENARMLRDLRHTEAERGGTVIIGGLVGPLGDGYGGDIAPSAEVAQAEMRAQVEELETAGVDVLIAGTLPNAEEALGISRALAASTLPYIVGVVVRADGTLLDETPLRDFVERVDHGTRRPPLGYALNCVHPTIADGALAAQPIGHRAIGLFANASALTPEELDGRDELDASTPEAFAVELIATGQTHGLSILGGCCGTDASHLRAVAALLRR